MSNATYQGHLLYYHAIYSAVVIQQEVRHEYTFTRVSNFNSTFHINITDLFQGVSNLHAAMLSFSLQTFHQPL